MAMTATSKIDSRPGRHWLRPPVIVAAGALALALASCGKTSSKAQSTTSSPAPAASAPVISATTVDGVGTVLVNGDGRTLYILSSEKGNKVTCTDGNGCTKVWPDSELPKGVTHAIAGTGVQPSLLGVAKRGDDLYVSYATYPLYTYVGDTGPGQVNGKGIVSFGGTWGPITPAGTPLLTPGTTTGGSTAGGSTTGGSARGGGSTAATTTTGY